MLVNTILLSIIIIILLILIREIKKPNIDRYILPECKFTITQPHFNINDSIRIVKFSVITKNKNRYFRDFPIGFKFHAEQKFRSKIRITYVTTGDEEVELIYDRIVEFEDNVTEHIYYINDIILGSIDIEIYTESQYGKPAIKFEILQNNICHMDKEHKLEIEFPS